MGNLPRGPRESGISRTTVDLTAHPDLVVIYLGMRVRTPRGLGTLRSLGKQIERAAAARPDGLLRHEMLWYSLFPPHAGMRQYWHDFDALERWARSLPHKEWWGRFLRDPAARASGTRPTSCEAASKPSTSVSPTRWGYSRSRPQCRRAARSSQPGNEPASKVRNCSLRLSLMARPGERRKSATNWSHGRAHAP